MRKQKSLQKQSEAKFVFAARITGGLVALASFALLAGAITADSEPDVIDAAYSERPADWWSEVSASKYFNTSKTDTWIRNESCDDSGAFSVSTLNIWQDVPFITDYSDAREDDIGEIFKCADVVLLQEAWDYDDLIEDGVDADMRERGYNYIRRGDGGNAYCNGADIENDCSGLYLYSRHPVVRDLGQRAFNDVSFPDNLKEKGVSGFVVRKENRYYYVYNTHLTYGIAGHGEGNAGNDASRRSNLADIRAFISESVAANRGDYPPAQVIIGGDFNSDFSFNKNATGLPPRGARQLNTDSHFHDLRYYWSRRAQNGHSYGKFEYETSGGRFYSNWPGDANDSGPNAFAGGGLANYDVVLLGRPDVFATCETESIEFSGWAPQWVSKSNRRITPSYSWSDHYGAYLKIRVAQCE